MQRQSLEVQIQVIRATLRRLDKELGRLGPAIARAARIAASNGQTPAGTRRKPQLSPERRRALQIHGQYLGNIRGLKPRQKAQVKAAKAKRGYRAAIALARRLASK
jgi:hypothetical protein